MNSRRRWYWLAFFGLAAALALIPELFFTPEAEHARPPVAAQASQAPRPDEAVKRVAAPQPAKRGLPQADLFAAHSWARPPVTAPVVYTPPSLPPVAMPMTPPLPFQFIGRMDDTGRRQVFLLSGDRLHVVTVGDVIDELYRVERIDAEQMTLTYLPMRVQQSLSMESRL